MQLLQANNLICEYSDRCLFYNISIQLATGEALLVEGKNGSGKTSLLRILCGLVSPTAGDVRWRGVLINECHEHYLSELIYIGHQHGVKAQLTAHENLRMISALHTSHAPKRINDALIHVGLEGFENQLASHLSAGQQRRIALARLFLTKATLWILDEPFTALDSQGREIVESLLIRHIQQGGMAILTSHQPMKLKDIPTKRLTL